MTDEEVMKFAGQKVKVSCPIFASNLRVAVGYLCGCHDHFNHTSYFFTVLYKGRARVQQSRALYISSIVPSDEELPFKYAEGIYSGIETFPPDLDEGIYK